MKLAVIGSKGIVGGATSFGLRKIGHEVVDYDIKDKKRDWKAVLDTTHAFVCVPTPQLEDGSCDISVVQSVVTKLIDDHYRGTIVIKSTIPPGTVDTIIGHLLKKYIITEDKIIHAPETLRERHNISDFVENFKVLVVGCKFQYTYEEMVKIHGKLPQNTIWMTVSEAELFKYMHNAINALRIVFANEVYDIARIMCLNYDIIKEAVLLSTGLPDQYLDCNDNCRGYSSICFNKDIPALIKIGEKLGTNPKLIRTIVEANDLLKKTPFSGTRE